ncbi:MAG: heme-binding protein [Acidocella sp.]|nr:heme-binding protein [Acidocella sp.]
MRTGIITALMILSGTISAAHAADPQPQLTVKVAQLTLETAQKIAAAAIENCRKAGYSVAVTVVDRDGATQISERDTLAAPVALKISAEKAFTSAMFQSKGTDLENFPGRTALGTADAGLLFAGGSVPINVGGYIYGAIGVSGTPSGALDEQCAQAGLDAVSDDLAMQ